MAPASAAPEADLRRLVNALAEPYAYAVLTWPAVVGVFLLQGQAGQGPWHYLLYGWLGLVHLAAYTGGRGFGFGNLITFNSLCMTLACMTHPSPWTLAWLPVLLIGLLAAQRVRWRQVGTRHARRA